MEKYLIDIKNSNTRLEIKEIIIKLFNDESISDIDFDYLISEFVSIIENKLRIKIDNFENTDTSYYQKILELNF